MGTYESSSLMEATRRPLSVTVCTVSVPSPGGAAMISYASSITVTGPEAFHLALAAGVRYCCRTEGSSG
ncbi:hypothetical protein [Nonomuraea aridisoli]|uniref:Uncharacterized protein n=1 Tax=Nonomuraea aridisoli TaxID=2070368 RepID=A0A2W2DA73_9ACTN|nr:hypothetical protein [Nonomuraea aridisoli]PZG07723.1 hypothetical protein C1J01_40115 [Nonomuraea aridisoli]